MKKTIRNTKLETITALKLTITGLLGLALAVLVSGCATNNGHKETTKSGVVCPECRTIVLGTFPSSADWRGGPPDFVTKHECPGCRGVVTLVAGPGGYHHKCSTCQDTPYSCQVAR